MARTYLDNVAAEIAARKLRCSTCDARATVYWPTPRTYGVRCNEHPDDPLIDRGGYTSTTNERIENDNRDREAIQMTNQVPATTEHDTGLVKLLRSPSVTEAMRELLPKTVDVGYFQRTVVRAIQMTPALAKTTPQSFMVAVMNAATLGLECNTPRGHAYLLPFGNVCQLVVGYKGYEHLAYSSGMVASIKADVVRRGDHFKYVEGLDPILEIEHRVPPDQETKFNRAAKKDVLYNTGANVTHAFAICTMVNGGKVVVVLDRPQIEARRSRSQQAEGEMWSFNYEAAAAKTAIRALANSIPQAPVMALAASADQGSAMVSEIEGIDLDKVIEIEYQEPDAVAPPAAGEPDADGVVGDFPLNATHCPAHGVEWTDERGWGAQHPIEDGGFCKAGQVYRVIFDQAIDGRPTMETVGQQNDWLKKSFDGATWSKLTPSQMVQAIEHLRNTPTTPAEAPPDDAGQPSAPADGPSDGSQAQTAPDGAETQAAMPEVQS